MISMAPMEITRRLMAASDATDLSRDRLETKIDMSPAGITARLREASQLYAACMALRALGTKPKR